MMVFEYSDELYNGDKIFAKIQSDSTEKPIDEVLETFREFLRLCSYPEECINRIEYRKKQEINAESILDSSSNSH